MNNSVTKKHLLLLIVTCTENKNETYYILYTSYNLIRKTKICACLRYSMLLCFCSKHMK